MKYNMGSNINIGLSWFPMGKYLKKSFFSLTPSIAQQVVPQKKKNLKSFHTWVS